MGRVWGGAVLHGCREVREGGQEHKWGAGHNQAPPPPLQPPDCQSASMLKNPKSQAMAVAGSSRQQHSRVSPHYPPVTVHAHMLANR